MRHPHPNENIIKLSYVGFNSIVYVRLVGTFLDIIYINAETTACGNHRVNPAPRR
jgi:hypothetical protein